MNRRYNILSVSLFLCLVSILTCLVIRNANTTSVPPALDPNAVHWKDGELLAPLPADPALRADAIRQAKEFGNRSRHGEKRQPDANAQCTTVQAQAYTVSAPRKRGEQPAPRLNSVLPFSGKLKMPGEPFLPTDEKQFTFNEQDVEVRGVPAAPAVGGTLGSFDAIDYTGWYEASPSIAVGPDHVLVATTDAFGVYDKCGNYLDGGEFWWYFNQSQDFIYYDPKVIYDDWHGRFIMAYQGNDFTNEISRLYICVRSSSDLSYGYWKIYYFEDIVAGHFVDDTHIAVDPEGLYITFNTFEFNTFGSTGGRILATDLGPLYNLEPAITGFIWNNLDNPGDASDAYSLRPARMHSYNGSMYFLNNKLFGGDFFTLWTLTDPFGSPTLLNSSISTSAYETPPAMRQPDGSYVDGGDTRITDLIYSHGELTTVFTRLLSSGGDWSRLSLWKFNVPSATFDSGFNFYDPNGYIAYGAIDIDEYDRACLVYSQCSYLNSEYLSLEYLIYDLNGSGFHGSGIIANGLANFNYGGGTNAWGHYNSCRIDPVDDRTFWCGGMYAHNDPTPSWMTHVAAVTGFPAATLEISPTEIIFGGVNGGTLSPDNVIFTLDNTGGTAVNWGLSNVPPWLTPSDANGVIPPYGSQNIMLVLNDNEVLPVGEHTTNLNIDNCTGSGDAVIPVTAYVVDAIDCSGSHITLGPPPGVGLTYIDAAECSVSAYIRPMKDIEVCAIGIQSLSPDPHMVTGRIYETDGFSRVEMIAEVNHPTVQSIEEVKIIPLGATLQACREYEVEFILPGTQNYIYWHEIEITYPYDVSGVVRVTQGGSGGDPGGERLPAISIIGYNPCNPAITYQTDLSPSGTVNSSYADLLAPGLFISSLGNMELCSVEFEADLPVGVYARAALWTAAANERVDHVAEGYIYNGATGMRSHEIPLHALLEYGVDYNIEVACEYGGSFNYVDEEALTLPYSSSDGTVQVLKGSWLEEEFNLLPLIRLNWSDFASGGIPFDLAKVADGVPPPYTSPDPLDHGIFVTASVRQHLYGIGVKANIPPGSIVYARVYSTRGVEIPVRSSLMSEGWIYASKEGMQWHDIPIASELHSARAYDLSIVCSAVNEFGYWDDTSGLPYTPYGLYEIDTAEEAGSRSGTELIHMRLHACDNELTSVEEVVPSFTRLYLSPPIPNPSGSDVTIKYSFEKAGAADLIVYDVLGRRVATVFDNRNVPAGPGAVEFNTSELASGVYFVKLIMRGKAGVSQKMVIQR